MKGIRRIIIEEIRNIFERKTIVYHGTNKDFEKFDPSKIGSNIGSSWNGYGFYFSDSESEASLYGNKIIKVEINLNRPFDISNIKDSSIEGSGLVRVFANTDELNNQKYKGRTFSELNEIIEKLEKEVFNSKTSFSDGTRDWFKHVYLNYKGKEYTLLNRTKDEYSNENFIRSMFLSKILREEFEIDRLPIRPSEAIDTVLFSKILKNSGYDGIIANNSTVASGKEYVVFDVENILDISTAI